MTIRVLIADDHGVLRAGLRALLSAEPDLEVIGEAERGEQVLAALNTNPPVPGPLRPTSGRPPWPRR